jgi:hypothetical protein
MGIFGKSKEGSAGGQGHGAGALRHSRGWGDTLEFLKTREGLRVLDFGATSPANINYLTQLGQSVYMANVVEDAAKPEWMKTPPGEPKAKPEFDAKGFAAAAFGFSGKEFDAVLLWDTADYLPPAVVPLLFERLHQVLHPEGRLLAFFHGKTTGPETAFSRYHVTEKPELLLQSIGGFTVQQAYQTRQIEKFLQGYSDVRFLLGKDNVREVIAVR